MASFFVFIASASFVYTEQFGLSPTGFSLAFALNADRLLRRLADGGVASASASAWRG